MINHERYNNTHIERWLDAEGLRNEQLSLGIKLYFLVLGMTGACDRPEDQLKIEQRVRDRLKTRNSIETFLDVTRQAFSAICQVPELPAEAMESIGSLLTSTEKFVRKCNIAKACDRFAKLVRLIGIIGPEMALEVHETINIALGFKNGLIPSNSSPDWKAALEIYQQNPDLFGINE